MTNLPQNDAPDNARSPYRLTTFHEINVRRPEAFGAWCRLLWDDAGRVVILSDYGHWSCWWGHRGEGCSVARFLTQVHCSYAAGKMLPRGGKVTDIDGTIERIKRLILENRHNRPSRWDADRARKEWELARRIDDDLGLDGWFSHTTIGDCSELAATKLAPEWADFWERVWVPLVLPELRQIVAAETVAA